MKKPPPLPQETLRKVLKVSRLNGWSIVLIAGPATLVTLLMGDWFGSVVGALVTVAGAVEINGHWLLKNGVARGCRRLMAAQVLLFLVLWGYCLIQLANFNDKDVYASLPLETQRMLYSAGLAEAGLLPILRTIYMFTYGAVMLASLMHQGGLFRYYQRRTPAVVKALREAELCKESPMIPKR